MKSLKELRPLLSLKAGLLISILFLISSCAVHVYDDIYDTPTRPHLLYGHNFHGRAIDRHNIPISGVKILVNHWDLGTGGEAMMWHTITTDRNGYFNFTVSNGREGLLIINGVVFEEGSIDYAREGDNLFFNVVTYNFTTPMRGIGGGPIFISKKGKKALSMSNAKPFDFRVGRTPMGKDFFAVAKKYQEEDFKGAAKAGERYLKRYPDRGSERRRGDIERLIDDANIRLKSNKNDKADKENRRIEVDEHRDKAKESSWDVDKRRRLAKEHKAKKDDLKASKELVDGAVSPSVSSKGKVVEKNNHVNINIPSVSTGSASEKIIKMTVPLDVSKKNILANKPKPGNRGNGDNRKEKPTVPGCASVLTMAVYWSAPNSYKGKCVELRANFVERLNNRSAIYVTGRGRIVLNAANRPLALGGFNGIVRAIGKSKVGKKGKGEILEHFNVLISN